MSSVGRVALAGLLGLTACQASGAAATASLPSASDADAPLLRTYAVPPDHARSLEHALASALATGEGTPPLGTVERLPDGKLVVVAPLAIHEGIAALVAGLDVAAPAPAMTVVLDYWVIVGEAAAEPGGLADPTLAPALAAIAAEQGAMRFTLLEQARVASLVDESAKARGDRLEVGQVVSAVGGRLVADIDLTVDPSAEYDPSRRCERGACKDFRTRVHVAPGQLLVVGQTGLAGPGGRSLFFVVRGRTAEGG